MEGASYNIYFMEQKNIKKIHKINIIQIYGTTGMIQIAKFISLAQISPGSVQPYSTESWPETPLILFSICMVYKSMTSP